MVVLGRDDEGVEWRGVGGHQGSQGIEGVLHGASFLTTRVSDRRGNGRQGAAACLYHGAEEGGAGGKKREVGPTRTA